MPSMKRKPQAEVMTLDEAIKKYTRSDGSIDLPADLRIAQPKRTSIKSKILRG